MFHCEHTTARMDITVRYIIIQDIKTQH